VGNRGDGFGDGGRRQGVEGETRDGGRRFEAVEEYRESCQGETDGPAS
jgi:hypothetical protein